ncbi:hypothetical protein KFL_004190040 [Klebsormidium nitens]|uniref:Uncharacterized protein n=1 Tax=Klebsormidium nitens TaxID=105231 RepID=A0A1Y1ICL4_KLENI|nr:hypothetical protein KFL_004190040 [Klebsormidium nitens]|eukprot:GAQ88333.1 hypothetical protein KFL_004190040 [Klebsormidium nitens]
MAPSKGIRPLGMQRNNSEIPAPNKILEQRELEKQKRHHEERLSHVKSTSQTNARKRLDNTVPMTSLLLLPDHKKLLRETSRLTAIEYENGQLLEKLSTIAKSGARLAPDGSVRPGTALGNSGTGSKWPSKEKGRPASAIEGGLNQKARKMEKETIARENEVLLHRLLNARGKYRRAEWQEHERLHRLRMTQVSRYGSPTRLHKTQIQTQSQTPNPRPPSRYGSPTPPSRLGVLKSLSRPASPEPRPPSPLLERMLAPLGATTMPQSPEVGRPRPPEKVLRVPRLDLTAAIAYQEGGGSAGNSEEKGLNESQPPQKASTSSYGAPQAVPGGSKNRPHTAMPFASKNLQYVPSPVDSDTESESDYSERFTDESSVNARETKDAARPPVRKVRIAKQERTWVT